MAGKKVKVDFTGVESFNRASEGQHVVKIATADMRESQGGNDMISVAFEVTKGQDKGARVFENYGRNSLIKRLKASQCEWCGAENVPIEIHHVRKLKDLSGRKQWEIAMIGRKRKTMALCIDCHDKLHAGKLD